VKLRTMPPTTRVNCLPATLNPSFSGTVPLIEIASLPILVK
jgi:hypothetical protein